MQSVPIHLILSLGNEQNSEELKAAFIPLNGSFDLKFIISEEQLEAQIQMGIRVAVFASNGGLSWQECSRRIRNRIEKAIFILISDEEDLTTAISQGADLLISSKQSADLPIFIASLLKKNSDQVAENRIVELIPVSSKAEIDELQLKNKELQKINFELDRFVYSASHDLRAPLTSVLGLLYLLREEVKEKESQKLVDMMEESILRLDNTIRDIVAYSRNNRTEVQIEPLRIGLIIDDLIKSLRYLESGDIHLSSCVRYEDDFVFLGDKIRLTIILTNLISNSIKYKHPSRTPEVVVKVYREDSEIIITVADNGIGINEQHIGKIFDMFYRTNDLSAGSGLGLYIVNETVKKLDGRIEVKSKVNEGSIFKIMLPLMREVNNTSAE